MATAERIRDFIDEYLLDEPFTGEDPLSEVDFDSLGLEQLIDFIEEEYEIQLSEADLARENFVSVDSVAALVDATRQRAGPRPATPS